MGVFFCYALRNSLPSSLVFLKFVSRAYRQLHRQRPKGPFSGIYKGREEYAG